jgi:hypothetical protein
VSATTECVSADSRPLPRRCSARAESFERNGPCGDSQAGQCSYVFELNFQIFNIHRTTAKRVHPRDLAESGRSDAPADLKRARPPARTWRLDEKSTPPSPAPRQYYS